MDTELGGLENIMTEEHLGLETGPTLHFPATPGELAADTPHSLHAAHVPGQSSTERSHRNHLLAGHEELSALDTDHPHVVHTSFDNHYHDTSFAPTYTPHLLSHSQSNASTLFSTPLAHDCAEQPRHIFETPSVALQTTPHGNGQSIPRFVSYSTHIREAARRLFFRKKTEEAEKNIKAAENALTDKEVGFEIYVTTLLKKHSLGIEDRLTDNPSTKADIAELKNKLLFLLSYSRKLPVEISASTQSPLQNPRPSATPTRSSSTTSSTTISSVKQDVLTNETDKQVLSRPAALALIRTTIQVCEGDAALSQAVLKRLAEPLCHFVQAIKSDDKIESVDQKEEKLNHLFYKEKSSFIKGLVNPVAKERIEKAALHCAQQLANTRSVGLAPLLALQCNKREEELDLTGHTQEAALTVYLQTGATLKLRPIEEKKEANTTKSQAQLANLAAQKILIASAKGERATLEEERKPLENDAQIGKVTQSHTLSIEEWTAYLTWQWGYDNPEPKAALDNAIRRVLKANTTWIDRAEKLREPAIQLKEAKRQVKEKGWYAPTAIKERIQAQRAIFKAYQPQMHPAGHNKTPYWLPRKIFFSEDHVVGAEQKVAYGKAINTAILNLYTEVSAQFEQLKYKPLSKQAPNHSQLVADKAFACATLKVWREIKEKGEGPTSVTSTDTAKYIFKTVERLISSPPSEAGYAYFLEHKAEYKKELLRSWIPFLSKPVFFSVEKMEELASTHLDSSSDALNEFNTTLHEALKHSRAAPVLEARQALKAAKVATQEMPAYLQARNKAFLKNTLPGSSHATSNGNLSGFLTGPYLPTSVPNLLPSIEIGAEYGRSASAQITVREDSFGMAWGSKMEKQLQLGGGVYFNFLKATLGPIRVSLGSAASIGVKWNKQYRHDTILDTQYSPQAIGNETQKKEERNTKTDETLQLLSEAVEKTRDSLPERADDHEAHYAHRQTFLHHFTRACFDRPYISLSEQVTQNTKITNTLALQSSAYIGPSAYPNSPSAGFLGGIYLEATPHNTSHTHHIQHGQHQQQSSSKETGHQGKVTFSLAAFFPTVPIRLPARVDGARLPIVRRLSLLDLMDKTLWHRNRKTRLEHSFNSKQLQPTPTSLLVEVKRPSFTTGWFNRLDKEAKLTWEERYGSEKIEQLLAQCTPEPKGMWVLRERFALREEYADVVCLHRTDLEVSTERLESLQAAHKSKRKKSEIQALEAHIKALSSRIQQIYEGPSWEPVGLEVDLITDKSRFRGLNMVLKMQRQENETVVERRASLKPVGLAPSTEEISEK